MIAKDRVLVVDDAKIDRIALRKILEEQYEVVEAENGRQALDILALEETSGREGIAAILLDLVMPGFDGIQFMEQYRKVETYRRIPVIISTVEGDVHTERECLELGAWDFVGKPYDPEIIRFRLRNVIERSQTQLSRELKYRADYDILTGIYNKSKFFEVTGILLDRNPDRTFAFIRLDIEKFQLINSFFGMKEGDSLLRYIAEELKLLAGGSPKMAYGRIEADIFGLCLPCGSEEEIIDLVGYLRMRFGRYDLEFDIVPTVGICIVDERGASLNDLYDRANLAAKRCKGNYIQNYEFYNANMSEEIVREQKIVNRMKRALRDEEFILYLQPKYDLQNNEIVGAEVLVRWLNPTQGLVSPSSFIPVFERNGFIMKLDYYVWEKTCQLLHHWIEEGRDPQPLSVNISRVSIYNPRLVEMICGLVERYEVPPRLFQIELTESAYTSNPKAIREMMEQFQKAGFSILMDDFGSGYSSLNVLKDIAVDILKIDMKFLSDTDKQGRGENILASVVRMAKWLNMPVVAEGVERAEQVEFLRSIGCEYVQGFYFARPMPVEEYEKLTDGHRQEREELSRRPEVDGDSVWSAVSQMEGLFSDIMQAVAVYEYVEAEGDKEAWFDIIRVNSAYYDLFGYSDISDTEKQILSSIDEDGRKLLLATFAQLVQTREVTECEYMRRLDSGRLLWISLKLKYVTQIGSQHILFGTLTDITEQKEIDRELQKYRQAFLSGDRDEKTVLVVDDLEVNRMSLRCIFEDQYRVVEAANGQSALALLQDDPQGVDIILLDLMMPVMDGETFLERKRKNPAIAGIPVIIITADDTTKRQVQTLELGADDYIVKPFLPGIVSRRVRNVLKARQHFEKNMGGLALGAESESQAGLYRKKGGAGARENGAALDAVVIVEICNAGSIADHYSYKMAERLVGMFSERLRRIFAENDILARYNRDEFIASLTDVESPEELRGRLERLVAEAESVGGTGVALELAIGASVAGRGEASAMELLERADAALFEAEQRGKNQIVLSQ